MLAAAPSVGAGIRALFRVSFDALDDPDTPSRMCMMSAMLAPEVLSDPDLRRVVEDGRDRFRTLLSELIARDRELGHLPATTDAETTAVRDRHLRRRAEAATAAGRLRPSAPGAGDRQCS